VRKPGSNAWWALAVVGSSLTVVVALRLRPVVGLVLAGVVLLFALVAYASLEFSVGLLVVASFVTRARLNLLGFGFRAEHFAMVFLLLACVLHARRAVLRRMPSRPELAAFAFVTWAAVSSVISAPMPGKSLTIVGWYFMDVIILWLLVGLIESGDIQWDFVARVGIRTAAAAGWLASILWLLALARGNRFGVQYDYATGNIAAAGFSYEGNILGSQSVLWLGMALTFSRRSGERIPMVVLFGLLAGLATSLARAAWLGAAVMAAVAFLVAGSKSRRYHERRRLNRRTASAVRAVGTTMAISAFLAAMAIGGGAVVSKGLVLFQYRQTTGAYRLKSVTLAMSDLRSAGVKSAIGLGTNSFGQRNEEPSTPGKPGYLGILPLVIIYDTGIPGAILAAAFALGVLRRGRYGPGTHAGILAGLLVAATATNPMWFAFVWIVIALLLTAVDPPPRPLRAPTTGSAEEQPPALNPA
jgi:hypothetical protein